MYCKNCQSKNINYHKSVHKNATYHIVMTCEECFSRYNVPRDAYTYKMTKDQQWLDSESLKRQGKFYAKKRKRIRKGLNPYILEQQTLI